MRRAHDRRRARRRARRSCSAARSATSPTASSATPGFLRGHVVDFVAVGPWPVFNVADSCLTIGASCSLVSRSLRADRRRDRRRDATASSFPATLAGERVDRASRAPSPVGAAPTCRTLARPSTSIVVDGRPWAKSHRLVAGEPSSSCSTRPRPAPPPKPTRRRVRRPLRRRRRDRRRQAGRSRGALRAPGTPTARSSTGCSRSTRRSPGVGDERPARHRAPPRPRHQRPARRRAVGRSATSRLVDQISATHRRAPLRRARVGRRSSSPRGVIDAPDRPLDGPAHPHGGQRDGPKAAHTDYEVGST